MYKLPVQGKKIEIRARESARAKRLRLTVYCGGEIVVTVPKQVNDRHVEKFINKKSDWIEVKWKEMQEVAKDYPNLSENSEDHYQNHKDEALEIAQVKVSHWNDDLGFSFNKVRVKDMKTQWGSCTAKKNLHFNYKIKFLSEKLQDYLVVHELCHLKEPNHSDSFWKLVSDTLPDYDERHKKLRKLK